MRYLIKNNLKQKVWLTAILSVMFVLCRPMFQLMTYENNKFYSNPQVLLDAMESFFLPDVFSDYISTFIACGVIGVVLFSYLFSKRMVDLYHSIPVNRKQLFLANYVSGIIIYLIALMIQFVVCIAIAIPNHYMTINSLKNMTFTIVCCIIHFLYGYSVTILAVMLSGNIIVALAGTAVLSVGFPVVFSIIDAFQRYFYVTFSDGYSVLQKIITKFYWASPVTSFATMIARCSYSWESDYFENILEAYPQLIVPLLVTIIVAVLAYYLYMKRPSEAAGRSLAFKNSAMIIRIPVSIIGGFIGTWFMCTSVNRFKNGWIWLGLFIGVLLSHCILEVIFNESFKAFMKHKLQFVVTLALTVLIVGIFYYDLTGFDRYNPKRENITSAAIYFGDVDNNLSGMEIYPNEDEPEYLSTKYYSALENAFKQNFTDSVLIDKVYAITQIGLTCVDDMIEEKYSEGNDGILYGKDYKTDRLMNAASASDDVYTYEFDETEKSDNSNLVNLSKDEAYAKALSWMDENGIVLRDRTHKERTLSVQIFYTMKGGKKILRRYDIPVSKVKAAMNEIYKTSEYKLNHFDIYDGIAKNAIHKVDVYDVFENRALSLTGSQKEEFLKIYMSELEKMTVDTISELPIGRISPLVKTSERFDDSYSGYYIYPEFTKTLAYIESFGSDMENFKSDIKADEISAINVTSYNMYAYADSEDDGIYVEEIRYTNSENEDVIKAIAPYIANSGNIWSNEALIYSNTKSQDLGVDLMIESYTENGMQRTYSVIFKNSEVPEIIKKDIAIKIWEDNQF